ncbi:MAG: TIGR03621 family F420-dependent LLM class oxidoreductase [Ilumatobacter sp.]|jgi:probable F420-dependent oxidoreductase|uniref:TIGR03621 family F420-dependent LLM class oxidoreductase n=1 Tax=Ilumatobacter sp. TaxID=1967498 RepID=UPI00391BC560
MSTQRPFRFAVQSYSAESPQDWRDKARKVEELGYSALHLADHYLGDGPALKATNHPHQRYAAIPLMTMAAEATTTLKIGARVFCIDYRPLAILVKEAATMHWLSGGRIEFGLGAGWLAGEYEAFGIPMDRAGVRVSRLDEYVRAAKMLLSGEEVDIDGEYVSLHGFAASPVPETPMPIMIGGGAPRVLGIAGREADIVSLNFDNSSGKIGPAGVQSSTAEKIDEKVRWVREGAESAGRELPEIEIAGYFTVVTPDEASGAATAEQFGKMFGLEAQEIIDHPNCLIGTLDQIAERLVERRERYEISYVTVSDTNMEAFAPIVERLAGT